MSSMALCPDCKRPIERLSEHNYFFKMGQYQEQLQRHILEQPGFHPPDSRRNEVLGFLQTQKLGDLSISRPKSRLSWGIELPFDKDYVTYVWFDALVNYISALEYLPKEKPAGDTILARRCSSRRQGHPHNPCGLLVHHVDGAGAPTSENDFRPWLVDGRRREDVQEPRQRRRSQQDDRMKYGADADAFRYFLLREVPFGQDGDFSQSAMVGRINSELAERPGQSIEPNA